MIEAGARAIFMCGWETPRGFASDDDFFRERKKWNAEEWGAAVDAARACLAAVAPLIAAQEREACAAMVDDYQRKLADMSGTVPGVLEVACVTIAAAIRARGEAGDA
jgi:hypothetical protein